MKRAFTLFLIVVAALLGVAVGPASALLLKVHTSNYAIHGFTHAVPESELAELVAKLRQLDQDFAKEMARIGIDLEKLAVQDRADARARQYLARQMEQFFFGEGADVVQGYVPPSA